MSRTAVRTTAVAASALVAVSAVVTAVPAQAATVPGTAPAATGETARFYVPADTATRIDFQDQAAGGASTFRAGTYLVTDTAMPGYRYLGIETLSDRHAAPTTTYAVLTLDAPGPLAYELTDTGTPGTQHWIDVQPVPADLGDPADLSADELVAQVAAARDAGATGWDSTTVTAAALGAPAIDTLPTAPLEATNYRDGDAFGIGVDVEVVQEGNRFTTVGPDGRELSMSFGRPGDEMLVGDWDGDGVDTVGLRRGNLVFLDDDWAGGRAEHVFHYGRATDEVLVGDWDGDGADTLAMRRGNVFHLTDAQRSGASDRSFVFGRATDDVLVYDFHVIGADEIGVVRASGDGPAIWDATLFLTDAARGGSAVESYRVAD